MYTKLLVLGLLTAFSLPVAARDLTVADLAAETGMSKDEVRIVLGCRSCFANYQARYDRLQPVFRERLGEERYQDLLAGRKLRPKQEDATTKLATNSTQPARKP